MTTASPDPPTFPAAGLDRGHSGSFRCWMGMAGCDLDGDGGFVANSSEAAMQATGDTLVVVADPIAEATLGDLPYVAIPSPDEMMGGDVRLRWVWSGSHFHWLPGVDGHPGRRPPRLLDLDATGMVVSVDTRTCPPVVLDHLRTPTLRLLTASPDTTAPRRFERRLIAGASGNAAHSWRQSVRMACRGADLVSVDPDGFHSGLEAAFVVACAGAHGIPVWVQDITRELTERLHPALVHELVSCDPDRLQTDPYYRDLVGVRVRRQVLEHHSEIAAWRHLQGVANPPSVLVMVSTIRPEYLGQVVEYLNRQTHTNFEARVVIDRVELDPAIAAECVTAAQFPVFIRRNDAPLTVGEIYNEMMRESSADIAVIWDDDDHYAPEHLQDLVQALLFSQATIAGKWAEYFHLGGPDVTIQRRPDERYRDTPLIGGSNLAMWRSTVLGYGGFMPTTLGYDQELIERVRLRGGTTYRTHGYGYLATRRKSGHTWNPGDGYFLEHSVRQWPGLSLANAGFDRPELVQSGRRYR